MKTSTVTGDRAIRVWGAVTAALGALTVSAPRPLARRLGASAAQTPPSLLIGVLGARQLVQGIVMLVAPRPRVVLGGALVDALHCASMVVAVWWWPRFRRLGLVSAVTAGASAAVGAALWRRNVQR